jgi:glycerol-3-phosphate dehydrogenase subunit C
MEGACQSKDEEMKIKDVSVMLAESVLGEDFSSRTNSF